MSRSLSPCSLRSCDRTASISSTISLSLSSPIGPNYRSVRELFQVFFFGAGQQIEEGIEAAVQRPPELRDGAVERVQGQPGRRAIGEGEPCLVEALQGSFRDEPDAVNERVS